MFQSLDHPQGAHLVSINTDKLIFTQMVKEFSVLYLTRKSVYCIVDKNQSFLLF
jgi:hypothetical protein